MARRKPIETLATHEVLNQPPPFEDYDAYGTDAALREAVVREGAGWAEDRLSALGRLTGSAEVLELGRQANRHPPELVAFDRWGCRIDEVEYHPAYHRLMGLAIAHEVPSIAWRRPGPGAHVAHAALTYLFYQAEAGVLCSMGMCYAAVPALRRQPDVAAEWEPRLLSTEYDPRCLPAAEKRGVTVGMAMTEKQGGSDVRANTTRARPLGAGGPGRPYALTGHKWFCSMPMSDAFLTLAQTDAGLSCFLVPRWTPDGERNRLHLQRLKDKLGNRANASAEVEYQEAWAVLVGEEGRGVRTIMDMVQHTRLDAAVAPAALMRAATALAVHHATHRVAFKRRLLEQPLMQNVLADLAIESEAATALAMRVARAFDEAEASAEARAFGRIATAVAKYWLNKRVVPHVHEALEVHGGAGYVEESDLPRLYREAPLNGIWEGSGNVIGLDVLRAATREPGVIEALLAELGRARGADRRLDGRVAELGAMLQARAPVPEDAARRLSELAGLVLQGALLVRFAPSEVADAFCATRLEGPRWASFGALPPGLPLDRIVARAAGA